MLIGTALMLALSELASPSYSTLRDTADPIPNLGRFLERYVGDCESNDPSFDKKGCEERAAAEQKKLNGKLLVVEIETNDQLQFAEWDNGKSAYRLHLTPFFDERALALSVGKPDRLNKDGLPVVKIVPIWVKLPKGEDEFAFRRQLERGMVRLEMLVRPKKAWAMKRKDGDGAYRGVDVALVGVRLYTERGQGVLVEQTY
jgi:hypothetical protein